MILEGAGDEFDDKKKYEAKLRPMRGEMGWGEIGYRFG